MAGETDDLRARHAAIMAASEKQSRRTSASRLALLAIVASLGGGAIVWGISELTGGEDVDTGIPVSRTTDFPEDRPAEQALELPPEPPAVFTPSLNIPQTDSATLARLADLEAELEAARLRTEELEAVTERERELQSQILNERNSFEREVAALRSSAENDQERARETEAQLRDQLRQITQNFERQRREAEIALRQEELRVAEEQRNRESDFQEELRSLRQQFERDLADARAVDPLEQERLQLEQERLVREQQQRELLAAERERRRALEQQRVESGLVAIANAGQEGSGDIDRALSAAERFVNRGIKEVPVSQAQRISIPAATVPQGTVVQASLETAIDSSLPGAIRAVVSEDVHSLDGSAILIPAGSKLFGDYDAGIELGQRRILIAWTRILTPSNRSILIASYGADALGRSGTDGVVDTRFWTRFGNAAAISVIAGGADAVADQAAGDTAGNATADVADDFSRGSSSAINEALSIGPRIYVRQGESISVIIDRDLEIL